MATELCPQCGTARIGSFRFCRSCQFDFDALPAITRAPSSAAPAAAPAALPVAVPAPNTAVAVPAPNTAAALAAVAWLATAAATGFLALHQWDAGQILTSLGQSGQGLVANAISGTASPRSSPPTSGPAACAIRAGASSPPPCSGVSSTSSWVSTRSPTGRRTGSSTPSSSPAAWRACSHSPPAMLCSLRDLTPTPGEP
jgi:hypothetical protein